MVLKVQLTVTNSLDQMSVLFQQCICVRKKTSESEILCKLLSVLFGRQARGS